MVVAGNKHDAAYEAQQPYFQVDVQLVSTRALRLVMAGTVGEGLGAGAGGRRRRGLQSRLGRL